MVYSSRSQRRVGEIFNTFAILGAQETLVYQIA